MPAELQSFPTAGTISTGGNDSILLPRFRQAGTVPGFAVFTLRTSVRLGPDAVVSAQVNNLFNARYFSAGRLGVSPFAPSVLGAIGPGGFNYKSTEWSYTSFVAPGAPRALWLTITYAMPTPVAD
ncbi:MAG: TonB-dependent receptor [Gemmatimonadetes bacterium]|nr:TonB-dependent receptor [Gemmatimonadota bacterium]